MLPCDRVRGERGGMERAACVGDVHTGDVEHVVANVGELTVARQPQQRRIARVV
jgi:hypothetical protein